MTRKQKQAPRLDIWGQVKKSMMAMCKAQIAVEIRSEPGKVIVNRSTISDEEDIRVSGLDILLSNNKTGAFDVRYAKNGNDFIQIFLFFSDYDAVLEWIAFLDQKSLGSHYIFRFVAPSAVFTSKADSVENILAASPNREWRQEDEWGKYLNIPYSPDEKGFIIGWLVPMASMDSRCVLWDNWSNLVSAASREDWLHMAEGKRMVW